jgi:integrase
VLSEDEEERLMIALLHYPEAHAAVTLALHTGLRRMEILNLRLSNVDLEKGLVSVVGKGGKRRTVVPLNPIAEKSVRELISKHTVNGFLFHSRTGNTLSHKQGAFQSAVVKAKIDDLHFHDLRHTFSTRMRALTDPFTLKELLGHSRIETTEGYVKPSMSEMQATVKGLVQTEAKILPMAQRA